MILSENRYPLFWIMLKRVSKRRKMQGYSGFCKATSIRY